MGESDSNNEIEPILEVAHLRFKVNEYAIRDLGISDRKYDGSPVDCVIVRHNAFGNLEVDLINHSIMTKYAHQTANIGKIEPYLWQLQSQEDKEKVIRYLGAEFFLNQSQ